MVPIEPPADAGEAHGCLLLQSPHSLMSGSDQPNLTSRGYDLGIGNPMLVADLEDNAFPLGHPLGNVEVDGCRYRLVGHAVIRGRCVRFPCVALRRDD